MLRFINYQDLSLSILANRHSLPKDIDLVVGIPRSGITPAAILATALNTPMTDVDGLMENRIMAVGKTKKSCGQQKALSSERTVVIIDDCVGSGREFREVRAAIAQGGLKGKFFYAAVYSRIHDHPDVDIVLECFPGTAVYQWNIMHHQLLSDACVDIDGVLCSDPVESDQLNADSYAAFIEHAHPLQTVTVKISCLVTSRSSKYRELTEKWLASNGCDYDHLIMASDEDRANGPEFKARVFNSRSEAVFIESDEHVARYIASNSSKPVICMETMSLAAIEPGLPRVLSAPLPTNPSWSASGKSRFKLLLRRIIGNKAYYLLKDLSVAFRKREFGHPS